MRAYIKFLYLLPIAVMIAFTVYFQRVSEEIENMLLQEKFIEKKLAVMTFAQHTDEFIRLDDNWQTDYDYYRTSLILAMGTLNRSYMTYAVVYDENLNHVSVHTNDDTNFDPMEYPSFREAVFSKEMGDMIFPKAEQGNDVMLHFRWIPTRPELGNRFLTVVAFSKTAIASRISDWVTSGAVYLIVITTVLNIVMVFLITRLTKGKLL